MNSLHLESSRRHVRIAILAILALCAYASTSDADASGPPINCGLISGPVWRTPTVFGSTYRVRIVGSGVTCKTARGFASKMVTLSWAEAPIKAPTLLPGWHCRIQRGARTTRNAVAGTCFSSSLTITWDEGDGEFNPAACPPGRVC